jgi:hypothetical protein
MFRFGIRVEAARQPVAQRQDVAAAASGRFQLFEATLGQFEGAANARQCAARNRHFFAGGGGPGSAGLKRRSVSVKAARFI